jgi:hypothetical protein
VSAVIEIAVIMMILIGDYKKIKLQTYQKYACVVVDVQETKLLKPFFSYNEKCVQEVENLGNVENVQNESNRGV